MLQVAQRETERPGIDRRAYLPGGNEDVQTETAAALFPGQHWYGALALETPGAIQYIDKPHLINTGIQLLFLSVAMDAATMSTPSGPEFLKYVL